MVRFDERFTEVHLLQNMFGMRPLFGVLGMVLVLGCSTEVDPTPAPNPAPDVDPLIGELEPAQPLTVETLVPSAEIDETTSLVIGLESVEIANASGVFVRVDSGEKGLATAFAPAGALPGEIVVPGLKSDGNAKVTIQLKACDAILNCQSSEVATGFVRGQKKLVRVRFGVACAPESCKPEDGCADTCLTQPVQSVPSAELPAYSANWFASGCTGAAPSLQLGFGESAFTLLTDGAPIALERGPQGGAHLWLGVKAQGMDRKNLRLILRAEVPDGPKARPAQARISLDGTCRRAGFLYALSDVSGGDYRPFLGKELLLSAELVDEKGRKVETRLRTRVEQQPQ